MEKEIEEKSVGFVRSHLVTDTTDFEHAFKRNVKYNIVN